MIRGLNHAALATSDMEKCLAFYEGLLGFEKVNEFGWPKGVEAADQLTGLKDSAAQCVVLKAGQSFLEIFQFTSPEPKPADPDRRLCDVGVAHLSVDVTDLDHEYARLMEHGVSFINEPMWGGEGVRVAYGRDPDGNIVELQEITDPKHPMYRPE